MVAWPVSLKCELSVRAKAAHVDVALVVVVPPHDLLGNPTGDGQRDLAVALAGRRGFELCDALFEISAAVTPEIGGGRAAGGKPANQQACCHQGT